ncbi:hypothetical protein [Futiania mangrovi]|uniref:Uncharacterized protein n=1 Tax=Futiania mangrovi TaxID=2959716 RepID=A0A9J6PBH8_9PROT|nr:hypothetical protein [Futiania mangrovii]MCP1335526.1 hypothetical protein [Futiania mangrovii]
MEYKMSQARQAGMQPAACKAFGPSHALHQPCWKGNGFMARVNELRGGRTPFDAFLFASVGEDRNGNMVTVLSALARLGFDPWNEAANLAGLTRDGARARLGGRLERFGDVPALRRDHREIAQRLVDLLPQRSARSGQRSRVARSPGVSLGVVPVVALILGLLVLVMVLFRGTNGGGS